MMVHRSKYHLPLVDGKVQLLPPIDKGIKKLRISRKDLSKESFRNFCKILQQNKLLEELCIDGGFLELDAAFFLASAIKESKSLRLLRLRFIHVTGIAAKAILDGIAYK